LIQAGDLVPADLIVIKALGLVIDASSITGDSLPSEMNFGDRIYNSSMVVRGVCYKNKKRGGSANINQEGECVVEATGVNSLLGRCVMYYMPVSVHQIVFRRMVNFCCLFVIVWIVVELIVQFGVRRKSCPPNDNKCSSLLNTVVLFVSGINGLIPAVCLSCCYFNIYLFIYLFLGVVCRYSVRSF